MTLRLALYKQMVWDFIVEFTSNEVERLQNGNMRWNIFFFAFWATLSLLFFGETVWPHYILFGISTGLFLYGYDQFTLEQKNSKSC